MGLLTRLWNLNTAGCALSEPLRSVVRGRSRSVDVVGYLRSVLQEARPYARMKLMVVGVQVTPHPSPYTRTHVDMVEGFMALSLLYRVLGRPVYWTA